LYLNIINNDISKYEDLQCWHATRVRKLEMYTEFFEQMAFCKKEKEVGVKERS